MRRLADLVLSALLVPPCAVCGRPLSRPLDGAVCEVCWLSVRRITPPICDVCGSPLPSLQVAAATGGRCVRCPPSTSSIARARALGEYEGTLRAIIHALKYDRRRSTVGRLASMMRSAGMGILDDADALVPVPLHARRRRARGFNQARVLADAMNAPVWDILVRVRPTAPQVTLPAEARRKNVDEAFAIGRGAANGRPSGWSPHRWQPWRRRDQGAGGRHPLEDRTLVLIDDVTTTGATLEACARVLRAAGAREVRAITAARVVSEPPPESSR